MPSFDYSAFRQFGIAGITAVATLLAACASDGQSTNSAAATAQDPTAASGQVAETSLAKSRSRTTTTTSATTTAATGTSTTTTASATPVTITAAATSTGSIFTVQSIVDDMVQPNSNNWYPSIRPPWGANSQGNPSTGSYAYVDGKIRGSDLTTSGDGYSYNGNVGLDGLPLFAGTSGSTVVGTTPWFVVGDAYQQRNTSTNTRAHLRNFRQLALLTSGEWVQVASNSLSTGPGNYGAWYNFWFGSGNGGAGTEDVLSIGAGSALSDGRIESADGGSSLGSIGNGSTPTSNPNLRLYDTYIWHGFPITGYMRTRAEWQSQVVGTLSVVEAKLTLHNAAGPDDRAQSGLMINMGEDWYYVSGGNHWAGSHLHSRWKRLTNDWQVCAGTDIPAAMLRANPPPGFTN